MGQSRVASKLIDDASIAKRLLEKRNAKRSIFVALTAAATAILRDPYPLRLPQISTDRESFFPWGMLEQ